MKTYEKKDSRFVTSSVQQQGAQIGMNNMKTTLKVKGGFMVYLALLFIQSLNMPCVLKFNKPKITFLFSLDASMCNAFIMSECLAKLSSQPSWNQY
jgi:hypothetical protein